MDCLKNLIEKFFRKKNTEWDRVDVELNEFIEWNDKYIKKGNDIVLGRSIEKEVSFNLNDSPHLILVSDVGRGRTVLLKLWQMAKKDAEIVIIDFSSLEFDAEYEKIGEVISNLESESLNKKLELISDEAIRRSRLLKDLGYENIDDYNEVNHNNKIKKIGIFIDNIEWLVEAMEMECNSLELEKKLETLLILTRLTLLKNVGIHIFLSTKARYFNRLNLALINNIQERVCTRIELRECSMNVLGNIKASELKSIPGRMLFKSGSGIVEFQGYYFDDEKHFEIEKFDLEFKGV